MQTFIISTSAISIVFTSEFVKSQTANQNSRA